MNSDRTGQANPLIWGAIGAVFVTTLTVIGRATWAPEAMEGYSFAALLAAGFFWGWAAGMVKNWLARRP